MLAATSGAQIATSAAQTLSSGQAGVLLAVVIGGAVLAGIIVSVARGLVAGQSSQSIVRSWIAISLVIALLGMSAAAFEINDPQVRNTLLGGLVASTAAAIAFYFSSKGADTARTDILNTATTLAQGGTAPTDFSAATPPNGRSTRNMSPTRSLRMAHRRSRIGWAEGRYPTE